MGDEADLAGSAEGHGDPLKDRAVRFFRFLRDAQRLKSKPVRTVESYSAGQGDCLWLDNFPDHRNLDLPERPDDSTNYLFRIARVPAHPPPSLPEDLDGHVIGDVDDPESGLALAPSMRDEWTSPVLGEDDSRRRESFEAWHAEWRRWAAKEGKDRPVRELYKRIFRIAERLAASPEELQLVLGVACLAWRPSDHDSVKRHLLTLGAAVDFNESTGLITVRPDDSGEGLAFELDMLDPPRWPERERLNRFTEELDLFEGHPLNEDALAVLVQRLGTIVHPDGESSMDWTPPMISSRPLVAFAPALVLRRRSSEGLIRVFQRVHDRLSETDALPLGVRQLVDVVGSQSFPIAGSRALPGVVEGYLPLPANDQQRMILDRVENYLHTVVQGPPGTGKTHTIANLVAHLLARGQRVLVTAQTDRALHELEGKLPPEIANLTVSVVGRSRSDLAELKTAVQTLDELANSYDALAADSERIRLEGELDDLRRQLSMLTTQLIATRERETARRSFGRYEGTLARIAQEIERERPDHEWLKGMAGEVAGDCPLSNDEAIEWLQLLRDPQLDELGDEARGDLIAIHELSKPDEFKDLCEAEAEAVAKARTVAHVREHPVYGPIAALDRHQRAELRVRIEALADEAGDLARRDESWMSKALAAVYSGRNDEWTARRDKIAAELEKLEAAINEIGPAPEVDFGILEEHEVVQYAALLKVHLERGGALQGWRNRRFVRDLEPFLSTVRIDRGAPDTVVKIDKLLSVIEVDRRLSAVERLWPSDVIIPTEDTPLERWSWNRAEVAQLDRVIKLGEALREEEARLRQQGIPRPDWSDLAGVKAFGDVVDAAAATEDAREASQPLEALADRLDGFVRWPDAPDVLKGLAAAVHRRDAAIYRDQYEALLNLYRVRSLLTRLLELGGKVDAHAPGLRRAVEGEATSSALMRRLSLLNEAWEWTLADSWLATESAADPDAILTAMHTAEQRIRSAITRLTANLAQSHAVERLGPAELQALRAYSVAVRQLGRGTGRYASHRQRTAREQLRDCRDAVPAWVMPLYRIADTLDVDPDVFDVIIIDEASQAGLDAAFLQFLAPRIVVVGDDKQVSPAGVGLVVAPLITLASQLIPDMPNVFLWQSPTTSLFDLAKVRYGNLITLREHFRCVPEIIGFSNKIAYEPDNVALIPLRQYGSERLEPIKLIHVPDGYMKGERSRINPPEIEAVVETVLKCCADPAYDGKTFGVISLTGRAQAVEIERRLLDAMDPQEYRSRDLRCGDAADFQGSERDVMFLSMVAAIQEGRGYAPLTQELYMQRFNVAASRAKDQMWVFHSVTRGELTNTDDMRYQLLDYCDSVVRAMRNVGEIPQLVADDHLVEPFDSLFEQHVYNKLVGRGYVVEPQFPVYGYRIDLAVVGGNQRLGVECDGDYWHGGVDQYEHDLLRQRELERCGWTFVRVRASAFYREPGDALAPIWERCDQLGIKPFGANSQKPALTATEMAIRSDLESDLDDQPGDTHPDFASDPIQVSALRDAPHLPTSGEPVTDDAGDLASPALVEDSTSAAEAVREFAGFGTGARLLHGRKGPAKMVDINLDPESGGLEATVRFDNGEEYSYRPDEFRRAGFRAFDLPHVSWPEEDPSETRVDEADDDAPPYRWLKPYPDWSGSGFPDPRSARQSDLIEGLLEIVSLEGPITTDRAYQLFIHAAGFARVTTPVRSRLNRAVHSAQFQFDVAEFANPLTDWPQRVLRIPEQPEIELRELGPRDLYQVPLSEVAALMARLDGQGSSHSDEDVKRAILDLYGLTRLTDRADTYLSAALLLRGR